MIPKLCTFPAALLALTAATYAPAHGMAQQQVARGGGQSRTPPALNDPEFESALARERQIMAQDPDISVARLDELGIPQMRMDFHFGHGKVLPENEASLLALADRFSFDVGKEQALQGKDPTPLAIESWRNVLLSPSEPSEILPVATFFDPEHDLLVVFRPMRLDLSCSFYTAINYSSSGSTGQSFYWSFASDMIMSSVGPNRLSNSDPDLYLYYWNGSSYSFWTSSIASTTIDSVAALNSSCLSPYWRVRVYMFSGGAFSARATAFNAS